jgi:hypothetical protein
LGLEERRELVLLWAESRGGDLATLAARINHRLKRELSPDAVRLLLTRMGLMEGEERAA